MENNNETIQSVAKPSHFRIPTVGVLASLVGVIILVTTQTPGSGGPMLVLLFLLLAFVGILSVTSLIIQGATRFFGISSFTWVRLLYTSVAIASGVVFLIGLQTLRQLQVVDVALALVFEILLNFYLLRRF